MGKSETLAEWPSNPRMPQENGEKAPKACGPGKIGGLFLPTRWQHLEKTKAYDFAAALPLIGFYLWVAWHLGAELIEASPGSASGAVTLDVVARGLSIAFAALLVVLLVIRPVPWAKSEGIFPRIVAIGGGFASIAFLVLPTQALPIWLSGISAASIVVGTAATIYSLAWLGRSFSLFPEARTLVTKGPYRFVRHPVYLFEQVALFGVMLQYALPWSPLLFAIQFGLQILRMRYEERVLAVCFPEYHAYAARTARLLPGVY